MGRIHPLLTSSLVCLLLCASTNARAGSPRSDINALIGAYEGEARLNLYGCRAVLATTHDDGRRYYTEFQLGELDLDLLRPDTRTGEPRVELLCRNRGKCFAYSGTDMEDKKGSRAEFELRSEKQTERNARRVADLMIAIASKCQKESARSIRPFDSLPGVFVEPSYGLVWQTDPPLGETSVAGAAEFCADLELGRRKDWRLPTIDELRSLVRSCPSTEIGGSCRVSDSCAEWSCYDEELCQGCSPAQRHYPDGLNDSGFYWSATQLKLQGQDRNWYVGFGKGSVAQFHASSDNRVRCVAGRSPVLSRSSVSGDDLFRILVVAAFVAYSVDKARAPTDRQRSFASRLSTQLKERGVPANCEVKNSVLRVLLRSVAKSMARELGRAIVQYATSGDASLVSRLKELGITEVSVFADGALVGSKTIDR